MKTFRSGSAAAPNAAWSTHLSTVRSLWLTRLASTLLVLWVLAVVGAWLMLFGWMAGMMATHLEITDDWLSGSHYWGRRGFFWELSLIHAIGLSAAYLIGLLGAVTMWHVSRYRRLVVLIFPPLAALLVAWGFSSELRSEPSRQTLLLQNVALVTVVDLGVVLIGLLTGRAVTRWLVKLIIPPRLRVHLAFLWTADGLPVGK
jgi:hypothetical protein